MNALGSALTVGGLTVAADIAGKQYARANVELYHPGDASADFKQVGPLPVYVVHSRNEHIGRGLLPDSIERPVALVGAPVTLAGLAWLGSKTGKGGAVGAGLAAGGVIGNVGEFVSRDYVTDYIGIPGIPITPNLSDVALFAGAGLLAVNAFRGGGARGAFLGAHIRM